MEGEADSAKRLRSAIGFRGLQVPDVWVPDPEDATARSMRDEVVETSNDVVVEGGNEQALDEEALNEDRMRAEVTYQAAQTASNLFRDGFEHRQDQQVALTDRHVEAVVERALEVGT